MDAEPLRYPLAGPAPGELVTVAPGVHWIRLGMPMRLDHINVWAIDDGPGWTLVDTGMRTEQTVAAWERLMAQPPLAGRPLQRIVITHMHPDHIGMAGWLARKHGARLWMTRLEYLSCRVLVGDTAREAPADGVRFYQQAGWSPAAVDAYRARFGNFGKMIHALPDSYRRIVDGERIRIGAHDWEVVVGSGHSPEHACLHCADLKLLISGDQVLPRISSNVSVHAIEPDANPMGDWYASFDTVVRRVPDDVLVLPAHNDAFLGLHARIAQLRQGQDAALAALRGLLDAPRRVVDVFPALFRRPIVETDASLLGMATGEAIACLNYLMRRGEVQRTLDAQGVAWYSRRP